MKCFGDLDFEPAQQGELDSFCGVYAAVNFLSRRFLHGANCDARKEYFLDLYRHLLARGKVTPETVCGSGFKNGQIQAAFNKTARKLALPVKATGLSSVLQRRKCSGLHELLLSLELDEAVMVRVDDCEHWVLMHSAQKNVIVMDDPYPPASCEPLPFKSVRFRKADTQHGIVFLNAQTH